MSEPLFTVVLQNTEEETFLYDISPGPLTSPAPYIIIKNGETKYRLYFYDLATFFKLTSEDNDYLIQTGDLEHKHIASLFKISDSIFWFDMLFQRTPYSAKGLTQNELVIDGKDLYNPFKVQGLADAIDAYIAWQQAMTDASQDVTMQDAEQDAEQEQVLLSQDPDDPNAPIALRL